MNEILRRVYGVKIRNELREFGNDLTRDDVIQVIDELSNPVRLGPQSINLSEADIASLVEFALNDFSLMKADHVYIRGGGFYRDDEETILNKEEWEYYKKHRDFLSDHVFIDNHEIVESIDYETDQIIKKIPNPTTQGNESFLNKGLVVGYVQSGKTANFTHLISKAASIGYKFIVVLGGMTNTLRAQTQYRLDRELTGNNNYGKENVEFVSWTQEEKKYHSLTGKPDFPHDDDGDFRIPSSNFSSHFSQSGNVTIAVIKKLAREGTEYSRFGSVLGRLMRWVENRNDPQAPMPPLFIIDDEADQASIDGGTDDMHPTTINFAIRYLMSLFQQVSYVGYTATPFANVFINADAEFNGLPDLYPENFIYSLPEPSGYFGTRQFFNTIWIEGDESDLIYINNVPDNERNIINDPEELITNSLSSAFWDFIFSVIIRKHRDDTRHCGFMIHTDYLINNHEIIRNKVTQYKELVQENIDIENEQLLDHILTEWQRYTWKAERISNLLANPYSLPVLNRDSLIASCREVLGNCRIRVINGPNDNLDYNAEDLSTLICIGGNLMSRGVTIEGLTISYYLRESPRYDTLLQMGRWFGYREGYEDLVRVYTTQTIEDYFVYIMGVEQDLRDEIGRYQEERLTPRDFAPRVRAHMRMLPSSKMGNAGLQRSYARQTAQTIYLLRGIDVLRNNNIVYNELVGEAYNGEERSDQGNYNLNELPIELLVRFISQFTNPEPEDVGFDKQDILRYLNIRVNSGEIQRFDLRISGRRSLRADSIVDESPQGIQVFPVKRNARRGSGWKNIDRGIVNIGVISDSNDIPDIENGQIERPLLILYSIDRVNSDSFKERAIDNGNHFSPGDNIIPELDFNPKGYAIVFPASQTREGETDYYQQIMNQ